MAKKIFLGIAIVFTLIAAVTVFLAEGKIDKVNGWLKEERSQVVQLRGVRDKLTADLKQTKQELADSQKTVEDQKGQIAKLDMDLKTTHDDLDKAKMTADMDEKKVADITAERDMLQAKLDSVPKGVPLEQLATMQKDNADMKQALAEAKQVQDTMKQKQQEADDKIAALNQEVMHYKTGIVRNGMSGRVVAVDRGWNFVVVDLGDRRGAVVNQPLVVTRGGQMVAKLKITSVEPTTSIADVLPGTLARGQSVQPGDTVIYAGRRSGEPAAETAPSAVPAPTNSVGGAAPEPGLPQ